MPISIRRGQFVGLLTLTLANTNYNICDLIDAVIQAEGTGPASATQTITRTARIWTVLAHPGIDGVGANTNDILFGDALVSPTRCLVLPKGASQTSQSVVNNVDLGSFYVRSAGVGQKISVFVSNG